MRKLARFRKVRSNQATEFNNRDAKLRFLFGMYDLDMDNMISRNELLGMLQMMVGANITIEQVSFSYWLLSAYRDRFRHCCITKNVGQICRHFGPNYGAPSTGERGIRKIHKSIRLSDRRATVNPISDLVSFLYIYSGKINQAD